MQRFNKLKVGKVAHEFVLEIYKISELFPSKEMFGLSSQIRRAAVSIPANLAEGISKFTDKDYAHYVQISLGSASEVEYYLLLIKDLNFINVEEYQILNNKINYIKAMLINLLKKLRA